MQGSQVKYLFLNTVVRLVRFIASTREGSFDFFAWTANLRLRLILKIFFFLRKEELKMKLEE